MDAVEVQHMSMDGVGFMAPVRQVRKVGTFGGCAGCLRWRLRPLVVPGDTARWYHQAACGKCSCQAEPEMTWDTVARNIMELFVKKCVAAIKLKGQCGCFGRKHTYSGRR